MRKSKIKFIIVRLKNCSISELIYRIKNLIFEKKLKYLLKKGRLSLLPLKNFTNIKSLQLPSFQNGYPKQIREANNDKGFYCLNTDSKEIKSYEATHQNIYFADIGVSDSSPDIRAVWEPSRLQHISGWFIHFCILPNTYEANTYKTHAKKAVFQWISENPFPLGPHYISVMECGLRIPVFFYCLKLLDDLTSHQSRLLLNTIYQHAWLISRRLSLYSSLGNHTICECVGLLFAGAIFNNTDRGRRWFEKAIKLLEAELLHQIALDGGPTEQSLSYHRFVLDLYWLSIDFLEKNNLKDCKKFKSRLGLAENFLSAFQDHYGNMPSIGDSDDGFAVSPGIFPIRIQVSPAQQRLITFKNSGYSIIKGEDETVFIFDHGPLGMPPLYNHGHADALSIILSKKGKQILVDSGTFRYNGVPEWRRYFKGTRAHNTVIIDGLDQATQETGFIWSDPYKAELLNSRENGENLFLEAIHDGYARLKQPVRHNRAILFFNKTNYLIKDTFLGNGTHDFELNFHFHPDVTLIKKNGWWLADNDGIVVFIKAIDKQEFLHIHGLQDPLLGWYSPTYGIKTETSVLHLKKRGSADSVSFLTVICTESPLEEILLQEKVTQLEPQIKDSEYMG